MATKNNNQNKQNIQSPPNNEVQTGQPDLKRKLAWRMGFAGLMIVLLLGSLALFDYLSAPDEPESSSPRFTQPVPVPKKEITQPVKQAEPVPDAPREEVKTVVPEATTLPEPPARPEVDPQPTLPRTQPAGASSRPMPLTRTQPAGQQAGAQAGSQSTPAPAYRAAPAQPAEARPAVEADAPLPVQRQPVAPAGGSTLGGRLFSGYALQAGVFSDVRLAEEMHAKLTLNGIPSTFEARVQVGPFKTREEADAAREKMKALGIDAVMLMPPKGAVRR